MPNDPDHQSHTSSVFAWLNGQPDIPGHYSKCDVSLADAPGRKRKSHPQTQQQPQQFPRKSRRLAAISGNAMSRKSSRKSPTKDLAHTPKVSELQKITLDPDQTPRARRSAIDGPPETFKPPATEPSLSASSPSRGDSAASSRASRSRSPTKRLGDTQFSNVPIDMIPMGVQGNKVPEEVIGLVRDLRQISKGIRVIPRAIQHKMKDIGEDVDTFELMNEEGEEHLTVPGILSHNALWEAAEEVWQIALDCQLRSAPEATWNSEVHCRLFRLALRGHWKSKGIWYQDVTTARISDKSLVPSVATTPMQSKLVDYVMTIDSSFDFRNRIVAKLSSQRFVPSINQTSAEWIRFNPIAVSIETKRGAVDQDTAYVQLGMWTAAHFAKLRQLTQDRSAALPVLPLVLVQGHEWKMMLASMKPDPRLEMLAYLPLGDTGTLSGVYRVIAGIRRLAKWIDEQYRPWFEKEVLADQVSK